MAIYHLEAKVISRGTGRSAVAAAAYMSCSQIFNDYDGVQHDYTRKQGLVWQQVFLPQYAPQEWQDRSILWNAVEENERTKDSRLAREFVVALPLELNQIQWQQLLSEFIQEQFVSEGMCADVAIHNTDGANPHAHIMLTVRPLDEHGKWQYKTQKEYLCLKNGEERGFTAAEFKVAQADGWEKQYPYLVAGNKIFMVPSAAKALGYERLSKYPKSTRYGRQNPISERWNSDEQLLLWREQWAEITNNYLAQYSLPDTFIDHRSYTERGLNEQPTIHEGVTARALEAKGIISDRCEINRQIKADNALLRELKANVQKLMQTAKLNIPALAEAMENLRGNMIVLRYRLRNIDVGKYRMNEYIRSLKPELERYRNLMQQIKSLTKERKKLLADKKQTPLYKVAKQRDLSCRITKLTEDLEELKSQKEMLLNTLDCSDDKGISNLKQDISAMENVLQKLPEQEVKLTAEFNNALKQYGTLKEQAAEMNEDELTKARLALRPDSESSAVSRVQSAYGNKYDLLMMFDSKRDVAELLGEDTEIQSIQERLQQKQSTLHNTPTQKKSKRNEQER